jgi:hypothetical protein
MKSLVNYVLVVVIATLPNSTAWSANEATLLKKETVARTVELQEITALSSMQFYTYFALVGHDGLCGRIPRGEELPLTRIVTLAAAMW